MIEKEFVRLTMLKFASKLKSSTNRYMPDVAKIGIDDQLNSKQKMEINVLSQYIDNISIFRTFFEQMDIIPIDVWVKNINFYFAIISILLEGWEMTSKEKRCIILNFVDIGIEKGILKDSIFSIAKAEAIQHFVINEVYFQKIKNGEMIDIDDLCDLRVALMNLCVGINVIDEIINDIKLESNICSILENRDDSKLSPSMKKLYDSVLEYSNKFVLGDIDCATIDKIFKYREFGVRNNLSLLNKIIFGNCTFSDFKLLSDVLILFKSEFGLNQSDFVNIIFDIIERNINMDILHEDYLVFPCVKLPEELVRDEHSILIDDAFLAKLSNYPGLKDSIFEFSNFIKEVHSLLLSCYFNKRQKDGSFKDFNLSDLNNVKDALNKLEVNSYVVGVITKNLGHEVTDSKSTFFKNNEKKRLSSGEYKKYMEKLKTYIQFDETLPSDEMINNSMMILKFLTVKDKNICVDLMEKLGFSDEVVLSFLRKVERDNFVSSNIIAVYETEVKNWVNIYKEYDEYKDRVSYIEEVYKELCSCYVKWVKNKDVNSFKEYEEWCSILNNEIEDFYLVIDSAQRRSVSLLKKIRSKNGIKKTN